MAEDIEPEVRSELKYGANQIEVNTAIAGQEEAKLDLTGLPIRTIVEDIGSLPNEEYALLRRNSFGASDVSVLLGVNPYKNVQELIKEKSLTYLTEEEKAIGDKSAVKKGRDLEPLIIQKFEQHFGQKTIKPADMYQFNEHPFLTLNFDGVTGYAGQYTPVEIKVVTQYGEKHYNIGKTMFNEYAGFRPIQQPIEGANMSIQNKAAYYGIPPYYYTQLQMQMKALNAPHGYLAALFEKSWTFHVFFVWYDSAIFTDAVIQGYKAWEQVELLKGV